MSDEVDEIMLDAEDRMEKSVEALNQHLDTLRTGRASTSMVDRLQVEYYGTPTALRELALVSVPEPQLITIKPYDPSTLAQIEKAINQSELGLNPNNDGKVIRLQVPSLTEERRRKLTKDASSYVEDAKVSVRNIRRDALNDLSKLQKDKVISEDEHFGAKDEVQKLTDKFVEKLDEVGKAKEKEIMEI